MEKVASTGRILESDLVPAEGPAITSAPEIMQKWPSILLSVREQSTAVESLLRNAEPGEIQGNTLHIIVRLAFHKERLETTKYAHIVQEVLQRRLGIPNLEIVYDLIEPVQVDAAISKSENDDLLMAAVEEALLSVEA